MCSIIGSFSKDKIIELCELNTYRGQHSHSISYYYNNQITVTRKMGAVDYNEINIPLDHYCIVHMQAPTTEAKTTNNIHPAEKDSMLLWHNGIVKDKEVKRLQQQFNMSESWDTRLILEQLCINKTPDGIDGSFSCLYYNDGLYLFRNEISPMFIDEFMNLSSTKFKNSVSTAPNTLFKVDLVNKRLIPELTFETVENPYYFNDV